MSESPKPATESASAKANPQMEPSKPTTETAKPSLPSAAPRIEAKPTAPAPGVEPDKIRVQHCLIGFADQGRSTVPGKPITRTKEEAKALAYDILDRAKKGEDFDGLVKKYTDDSHPGIYGMTNNGKPPIGGYTPRARMVPAFGNVGFKLAVGEIGIGDYDATASPFGWHVIKRVE